MADQLFGRPLVSLPKATEHVIEVRFRPAEEFIYHAFERRLAKLILAESDNMTEGSGLKYAPVQLILDIPDMEEVKKKINELGESDENKSFFKRIDEWIADKKAKKESSVPDTPDEIVCSLCCDVADDPHVINVKDCKHKFCKNCILKAVNYDHEAVAEDDENATCPEKGCYREFIVSKHLKPWSPDSKSKPKLVKPRKGKDAMGFHPQILSDPWVERYDKGLYKLPRSAKLEKLMEQLRKWNSEAPDEKVVIFTQWRAFAALIGRTLNEDKIKFVYYTGDKTAGKRDVAVKEFENRRDIKVMICGLKCGGVGLNLAFASRAINVEQQAFGRIYRIPQPRETHFARLVVGGSIDERIYALQRKKDAEIDPRMKIKLTNLEMAGLFGDALFGSNGKLITERDYLSGDEASSDESDVNFKNGGSDSEYVD
ncbi:hypothetical protein HYFRA_00013263 [Hymenoscyphus fraxineus]|uniref:Uncharacterized protein n=1 Tax=Hymenoscyphus fraxineus TaxID=746836 RepID=A0A9N9Q0Y3_9HELO|nr:hypothetical protein HYFRA_00013263 [Hymenoscyphus fraxineus]